MTNIYLTFSKSRRLGIFVLILLNLIATLSYFFLPYFVREPLKVNDSDFRKMLARLDGETAPVHEFHSFPFDPNTLDAKGFQRLGLSPKLSQTIIHYRNKGGHFYTAESFRKVWGLKEEEYQRLFPLIRIETKATRYDSISIKNLNTCDTSDLIAIPGIGSTLASNIMAYRRLLGGFVRLEQLKEVWGIQEETYQKIRPYIHLPVRSSVRKININTATLEELKQHPYLRGELALQIVQYRKSVNYHIEHIEELKSQTWLHAELFRKIAPYISVR